MENLVTPSLVRSLAWAPPEPLTLESVSDALRDGGAREWQIERVGQLILDSFLDTEALDPETGVGSHAPTHSELAEHNALAKQAEAT